MRRYYDRRADEYDATSLGSFSGAAVDQVVELTGAVGALPPAATLDVACGTGFLTTRLAGAVVGLDQSRKMLREAGRRGLRRLVQGDGLILPFPDRSFDRVFSSFFYCHLEPAEGARFVEEAFRVAPEVIVVAERRGEGSPEDGFEVRRLEDGSRHRVFKRYLTPELLGRELGGETAFSNDLFLVHRTTRPADATA